MTLLLLAFITGIFNGLVLWAGEVQLREYHAAQSVYYGAAYPTGY
jgi:hypothetical protein